MSDIRHSTRRTAQRALFVSALLAIAAGVLAVYRLNEARAASQWAHQTRQSLDALHELRATIAAIEAAQHALITQATVASDTAHHTRSAAALAGARSTFTDSVQQQRLDTLEQLLQHKLHELSSIIALVQSGELDSARTLARDEETESRNNHVAGLLVRLGEAEHSSLRERSDVQSDHASRGRVLVGFALAAAVLFGTLGFLLLRREERRAHLFASAAKAAEETARQNEERFRTALDAMRSAFMIARPTTISQGDRDDFDVIEMNAAGAALLGCAAPRLIGARLSTVLDGLLSHQETLQLLARCRTVHTDGVRYSAEYRLPALSTSSDAQWLQVEIVRTGEGVAISCHDITASKHATEALAALAVRDELTGLLNRRGFREQAELSMKLARRTGRRDAVLSLDLTGFKQINDTFGHAEGDVALREVARILESALREVDLIARLGGDEFVVYAPAIGAADHVELLAVRIAEAFESANEAAHERGRSYRLATGIGTARIDSEDTLDAVLARADVALYAEKRRLKGIDRAA